MTNAGNILNRLREVEAENRNLRALVDALKRENARLKENPPITRTWPSQSKLDHLASQIHGLRLEIEEDERLIEAARQGFPNEFDRARFEANFGDVVKRSDNQGVHEQEDWHRKVEDHGDFF